MQWYQSRAHGSLAHNLKATMWKVILVTGGNKGIGLAIVEALLQEVENSVVLLGSRDAVRGQEAADGVVAKLGKQFQPRLQPVLIDVTSQESVDKAAAVVKKDHGKIYGVIDNAGGSFSGLRATIDLNPYGALRVCEAFAPLIEDGGRIVQVSSAAGPSFVGKCTLEMQKFCIDPNVTWKEVEEKLIKPFLHIVENEPAEKKSSLLLAAGLGERSEGNWGEYGLAKAAVNCYSLELARRLPKITVSSCTPGYIATDLTKNFLGGKTAKEAGMKTPAEGARCPVYLMTEKLSWPSGWFFGSDCVRSPLHKYRSPGAPAYAGEFP